MRCLFAMVMLSCFAGRSVAVAQDGEKPALTPKDHIRMLRAAEWEVCAWVENGRSWSACRAKLEEGLALHGSGKQGAGARRMLESLRRAEARAGTFPEVGAGSSLEKLAAALPTARVPFGTVLMPHQYSARAKAFSWDVFVSTADHADTDPAALLYRRSRAALRVLVQLIEDETATRSVIASSARFRAPQIFTVGDLALGMLEGISGCDFRGKNGLAALFSTYSAEDQRKVLERVQLWWTATKGMTPEEAVLWQVERSRGFARERMLRRMIEAGAGDVALTYMAAHFHDGDELNFPLALLMLRAGSQAPLDYVRKLLAAEQQLTPAMARLLVEAGEPEDFKRLENLARSCVGREDRHSTMQLHAVATALAQHERRINVPVMVAIIEGHMATVDIEQASLDGQVHVPVYLDMAARQVQRITGVHFGYEDQAPGLRRMRACEGIVAWWQREGRGAYGLAQSTPNAPAGVR